MLEIGYIVSIGLVILDTVIKSIIFHIVFVNTSFLLCFADISNHKVFFNKITN